MRLFVAIPLPESVRDRLADLEQPVEGVRWQRRSQLHITLKFLGDTREEQLDPLVSELSAVRQQEFSMKIKGLGCFPQKGPPRILWAGISNAAELKKLKDRIEEKCVALGFDPEERPFKPHITLGRIQGVTRRDIRSLINQHKQFAIPDVSVREFVMYESILQSDGAVHKRVSGFPLQ
ncbi:2'-5' RNA ligase [Fodinibius roseus]|uniref:RNA 2',3'-cyclic phosphodiesterase n=1 Tax=Fodinibius roseus TaxID=1194090 RepID=A0A1M4XTR1_9BACT|nr:RNA 2',3'-cyclic phosphodiesterase [Fodinibius roseus]SHE96835.1 2'-5' RNA ligase [Fodinibius roseus]